MDFFHAIETCFRKYATFSGRAKRPEFWYWILFVMGAGILGDAFAEEWVMSLFGLATLLPGLAVGARRLHDIDRTGWWLLLILVPLLGWIVLLYFHAQPSDPNQNRFGDEEDVG